MSESGFRILLIISAVIIPLKCAKVGFYNTAQKKYILESINDISGDNPPPQQTQQISEIIRESNELELDALCLSNLLLPKQLNDYQTALNEIFPYSFSQLNIKPDSDFDISGQGRTHCKAEDFVQFQSADSNCSQAAIPKCDKVLRADGTNVLDFLICLAQECPLNYEQILYGECIACLSIFIEANNWDPNTPGQAIGLALYACGMPQKRVMNFTDGTMILSKHEIKQSFSVPIPSFIFYEQRLNVVQLDIEGKDTFVACVDMNPTTYKDNIGSFVAVTEEQREVREYEGLQSHIELNNMQLGRIIEYLGNVVSDDAVMIVMGDLGLGSSWNYEPGWLWWMMYGFGNFYDGKCTFCADGGNDGTFWNPLATYDTNNLFDSYENKDLDHILFRVWIKAGYTCAVEHYERFMTEGRFVPENGQELPDKIPFMPLSDRWGVFMEYECGESEE